MIRKTGLCLMCEHLSSEGDETATCSAYPQGIPDEIFYDGFDHRNPAPDDHGIRFKPDPSVSASQLAQFLAKYEQDYPPEARDPNGVPGPDPDRGVPVGRPQRVDAQEPVQPALGGSSYGQPASVAGPIPS